MKNLFFLLFLLPILLNAQKGSLLLVGGGSESNDYPESWSTQAYTWAVEQAPNKKVAVIHYKSTGDWLKPYFTEHCGAVESENFVINSANANEQSTIDDLMEFDMFFFRGGDQYYYYTYYNGTLMEQAMKDKFNEGGVLAGTSAGLAILSGVIFWAEKGSAYSDIVIKNIEDSHITLADDFMETAPDLLFDSHFVNRGRMGRLAAFMANYEKSKGKRITGVGVDETTALAITRENKGIAFGTRGISFFKLPEENDFGPGPVLTFRNMDFKQIVHGDTIDLTTLKINGLNTLTEPGIWQENAIGKLYLGGSATLSTSNVSLLEEFLSDGNGPADRILVITGSSKEPAEEFKNKLEQLGAEAVEVGEATPAYIEDPVLQEQINKAGKIIFVNNSTYNLKIFLASDPNGKLLSNKIHEPGLILAFIGDDARLSGPWIVNNYLSGNEGISLSEGLGILNTSCIIPRTFDPPGGSTDGWYTTHISMPYAMLEKGLAQGIWLNHDNYAVYKIEGSTSYLTSHGSSPVMFLQMAEGKSEFTEMTYNGQPGEIPNKIAGFNNMKLSFLGDGESVFLGNAVNTQQHSSVFNNIFLYPNPAEELITVSSDRIVKQMHIMDLQGRVLYSHTPRSNDYTVPLNMLCNGIYFLEITTDKNVKYFKSFIKY